MCSVKKNWSCSPLIFQISEFKGLSLVLISRVGQRPWEWKNGYLRDTQSELIGGKMVFGKNEGKRKKKEGDNPVAAEAKPVDPKPETPKRQDFFRLVEFWHSLYDVDFCRSKIYAQRKFAQGSNTSGFVTPNTTPVKEKEKTPSPVVLTESPHKKPTPRDFLTFLCYRGA